MARMTVEKEVRFESAHRLPLYDGPCKNLHGHSYKLVIAVEGEVEPASGIIVDFYEVQRVVQREVLDHFDHKYLNDFMENPTAEHIALVIWRRMKPALPGLKEIRLFETIDSCVVFRGEGA